MSEVEVVNLALGHLGEEPISALTEGSQAANVARRTYDVTRRALLREHVWNFAIRTVRLARIDKVPSGFRFAFALPSDYLAMLDHRKRDGALPYGGGRHRGYQVAGGEFFSNSESAQIDYIADVVDPDEFDPMFVSALSYRLASVMAKALSGNDSDRDSLLRISETFIAKAAARSGREEQSRSDGDDYINARR